MSTSSFAGEVRLRFCDELFLSVAEENWAVHP